MFPFGYGLSYTRFAFSNLHVSGGSADGTGPVDVSATVTNVGRRAGSDVAQLYLDDPAAAGEPPRQLVGFQRVSLAPGAATRVRFQITPRDTWWWDTAGGGWSQSAGTYGVYVGDSSALADLPLHGTFQIATTAGARQVHIRAPRAMRPGHASAVTVRLSRAGDATLSRVQLALQLPGGFTARPLGPTRFDHVTPGSAPSVTFLVTPPSWQPPEDATVHATARLGALAQREAGVSVTVR